MTTLRTWTRRQTSLKRERNLQISIGIVAVLLFISPVIAIMIGAFRESPFRGGWTMEPFVQVLTNEWTYHILWQTIGITVATVIPAMIIATFFAVIVTRTNAPLRWLITVTMAILVATPPLFYAISWGLLGNASVGLLNEILRFGSTGSGPIDIESWGGLVAVSILRSTGFMFLLLIGPFSRMDRSLEEASRTSGATALRSFFGTQLPVLFPAISGVLIISAVATLEAFDIPMILGVPAGIYVLPTEIYYYLNSQAQPMYSHASVVSLILLVILVLLLYWERKAAGRRHFTTVSGKGAKSGVWDLGPWRPAVAAVTIVFSVIAVGLPLFQLVLGSLSPYFGATGNFTLRNFEFVLNDDQIMGAFAYTAGIAATGALVAVVVTTIMMWVARLRRGWWAVLIDSSQLATMALPGLLLALGILTVVLAGPLAGMYGTSAILSYAMFVAVIPLASRSISGALAQIPAELEEATRVSGGSRARAMVGVVFRLLAPSALNGWLLCFVVLSGTLAVPLLLSPRTNTLLSVRVFDLYTSGSVEIAAAVFVVLIVEILAVSALVWLLKYLLTSTGIRRRPSSPAQPGHTMADFDPDPSMTRVQQGVSS